MENIRVDPISEDEIARKKEQKLKPEVEKLLAMFESAGFLTTRGSNSYTLAQIIVDYTSRVLETKAELDSAGSYWSTQQLDVILPLAFDRYRIYPPRSNSAIYQVPDENYSPDWYIGESKNGLVRISENEVQHCKAHQIILTSKSLTGPVNLKVPFNELLAQSACVALGKTNKHFQEPDFFESFMDGSGRYVGMDYVILPGEDLQAWLLPLRDFTNVKTRSGRKAQNIKLVLFVKSDKPLDEYSVPLSLLKPPRELTADYIRFVTTELFAKFSKLNRLDANSFAKFLTLKYQRAVKIVQNKVFIDLPAAEIKSLEEFANQNVVPFMAQKWEILQPSIAKLMIVGPDELKQQFKQQFNGVEFDLIASENQLRNLAELEITKYYLSKFGAAGFEQRERDKVSVDIALLRSDSADSADSDFEVYRVKVVEGFGEALKIAEAESLKSEHMHSKGECTC